MKGNGFQAVFSGIEDITERLGLEWGIMHFPGTDQLVEDFSLD